jgi:hypothetical protein
MIELQTEQLLYLLYAKAYSKDGTVTKGEVKGALPKSWKGNIESVYKQLNEIDLIKGTDKYVKPTKRLGRFSITKKGEVALFEGLRKTKYRFSQTTGYKVLNTLINCLQSEIHTEEECLTEISFVEFREKFRETYFKERKRQSSKGVVAVFRKKILEIFKEEFSISQKCFEDHFASLREGGDISISEGREDQIIEWVE